jgi:sporulation protein YlmC with PRC-barrel domain
MQTVIPQRAALNMRAIAVPMLAICLVGGAASQTTAPARKDAVPTASAMGAKAQPTAMHSLRATELIGMKVNGALGKNVGQIKDLVVNVETGDVRYALLEFDPGFFKSEKLFGVPLKQLTTVANGKTLHYADTSRQKMMEASGVDKKGWETALENRRYVEGLDKSYGFKPPQGTSRSFRASELIGKDVDSRAGQDIGEIKELVIDLANAQVSYAVLAFDPSWTAKEKLYAFRLTDLKLQKDNEHLMLDIDRAMLASMKEFDANRWASLNDLKHDAIVNAPPVSKK